MTAREILQGMQHCFSADAERCIGCPYKTVQFCARTLEQDMIAAMETLLNFRAAEKERQGNADV